MTQYRRVGVIIIDGSQILLMRRVKNGRGYYAVPGGRPEHNETPQETAIREIFEETTLHVVLGPIFSEIEEAPSINGKGLYYLAQSYSGTANLSGPEKEISTPANFFGLEWIELNQLKTITLYPEELSQKIQSYFLSK